MNDKTLKQCPCENCDLWKGCAIVFGIHFGDEGCPFKCDEYVDWKCRAGEENKHD